MFLKNAFSRTARAANDTLPGALQAQTGNWRHTRLGGHAWTTMRACEAALFIDSDRHFPEGRFALELTYQRPLSAGLVVRASAMEIQRLAAPSHADLLAWTRSARAFIPDVKKGDRILGLFDSMQGVCFYLNDCLIGKVDSPAFAVAFASIWLDARTRAPDLRAALTAAA